MAHLERPGDNLGRLDGVGAENPLPRFEAVSREDEAADEHFRGAPSLLGAEPVALPPGPGLVGPAGPWESGGRSSKPSPIAPSPMQRLSAHLRGAECFFANQHSSPRRLRAVHVHDGGVVHFTVVDRTGSACPPQEAPVRCGGSIFGFARLRGCSVAMSNLVSRMRVGFGGAGGAVGRSMDLAFDEWESDDDEAGDDSAVRELAEAISMAEDERCGVRSAGVSMLLRISGDPQGLAAAPERHFRAAAGAALAAVRCNDVDTSISAWALLRRIAAVSEPAKQAVLAAVAETKREGAIAPRCAPAATKGGAKVVQGALRPCEHSAVAHARSVALAALGSD